MKYFFLNFFTLISIWGIALTPSSFALSLEDLQKDTGTKGSVSQSVETVLIKPANLPSIAKPNTSSIEASQSVLFNAMDMILIVAGILAVIFIAIGGFIYVINAGEEDMQNRAKDTVLYAVFGLLAIFVSFTIVENTIRYLYNKVEPENYQEVNTLPQEEFVKDQSTEEKK